MKAKLVVHDVLRREVAIVVAEPQAMGDMDWNSEEGACLVACLGTSLNEDLRYDVFICCYIVTSI